MTVSATYWYDDRSSTFPRAEVHCDCGSVTALTRLPDDTFQCKRCRIVENLRRRFGHDVDTFLDLIRPIDLSLMEVSE